MSTNAGGGATSGDAGPLIVVTLGMSAGGLAAAATFLRHVPADTGLAFVVLQHLSPHHDSALTELLARSTPMPVVQIAEGMRLLPDRVHVLPPDATVSVEERVLRLLRREEGVPAMPIDLFLRALAQDTSVLAIAVILSGNGHDGSLGVQAVRERGGLSFAQSPDEAACGAMPASAIATGCIDVVLPAARLGAEVVRVAQAPLLLETVRSEAETGAAIESEALQELMRRLRAATGVNFALYRPTTIQRRLLRRIALRGQRDLHEYLTHLDSDPGELQELARDLLISVTRFFRDAQVFAYLSQTVFPELIRHVGPGGEVRIWTPGCSTGEEAYSLAMTFLEARQRLQSDVTCKVFATDVNEAVIEKARNAFWTDSIRSDVSAERLASFFVPAGGGFRIQSAVRSLCIFSRHDLLSDPPLSKMDLVSCRNLLIYLGASPALDLLHFALRPRGYLLLGRAESVSSRVDLFESVDKEAHLFRARETVARGSTLEALSGLRGRLVSQQDPVSKEDSYEELLAANEEMQSLNEELESSKEEIESVNEELATLNEELLCRNAALKAVSEFSEATLAAVRSALVVLDREHRVIRASRSFYEMFRLDPASVERKRLAEIDPGHFASPGVLQVLEGLSRNGGRVEEVELPFELEDRAHRVLTFHARGLEGGERFLISIDDVTRLRQLESESRHSQKMEAIGLLAAGVAHDFNNLLTVVLGGSQVVADGLPQESPLLPTIRSVGEAALRAADLTRQLLAYAGKAHVYLERVSLSDIVRQTADLLHGSVPTHVRLRLELERDLPLLLADPSQMHQVADNLIKNGMEAIGESTGTVTVRTGRQQVASQSVPGIEPGSRLPPGEYVFLEVQDTGEGMTPESRLRMFDPFFTTKFTGRGLGLAAAHGIVRQHGGTFLVHSTVGRGTSIRVLLALSSNRRSSSRPVGKRESLRGTGTILVIDDEQLVRTAIQSMLDGLGYQVILASSGALGIELLRANPQIVAVVLDVTMPEMDGPETLSGLRTVRPDLPVLVCSGQGDTSIEAAFAERGVSGFLHKPFESSELGRRLAACLAPRDPAS